MKNILSGKWALKNKVEGGHEGISYYGLPSSWATNILLPDDAAPERRNYYGLSYAGELKLLKVPGSSSHLRRIGIDYGFFSDDTQSSEHRFSANQKAVIDLSGQALDLGNADFLSSRKVPFQSALISLGCGALDPKQLWDLEFTIGVVGALAEEVIRWKEEKMESTCCRICGHPTALYRPTSGCLLNGAAMSP